MTLPTTSEILAAAAAAMPIPDAVQAELDGLASAIAAANAASPYYPTIAAATADSTLAVGKQYQSDDTGAVTTHPNTRRYYIKTDTSPFWQDAGAGNLVSGDPISRLADGGGYVRMTDGERTRIDRIHLDFSNPDSILDITDESDGLVLQIDLSGAMWVKLALGVANGLVAEGHPTTGLGRLSLGTVEGQMPLGAGEAGTTWYNPDVALYILSSDNRILAEYAPDGSGGAGALAAEIAAIEGEVTTARGSASTLTERLDVAMTADGAGTGAVHHGVPLRNVPSLLSRLNSAVAGTAMSIALIGDSWTDNDYYTQLLAAQLVEQYGDAGDGFCPVLRGSARGGGVLTKSGTWTTTNGSFDNGSDPYGPTTGAALIQWSTSDTSTPARATYTVSSAHTSAYMHAVGNGAVVRYRLDGGSWTDLTLSGADLRVDQIAAGSYSVIDIELVSGTWVLAGVEGRKAGPGVRSHNLGAGSGTMQEALACNETDYVTSLAAMQPDIVIMGWGVNEALGGRSLAGFMADQDAMLARIRLAAPRADIIVWSPPEVLGGAPVMRDYAASTRANSIGDFVHLNLQPVFGETIADYGDAGRQYMGSLGGGGGNDNHPTVWGGHAIARTIRQIIEGGTA